MANRIILNPFTGELELHKNVADVPALIDLMNCESGAVVGDLVYQSQTVDGLALVAVDNNSENPVIGVISSKPSSTKAKVTLIGIIEDYSGLTKGQKVMVGLTGEPTTTPPTVNYLQTIGFALSETKIYFRPEFQRVKR